MKFAIIEDEMEEALHLKTMIQRFFQENYQEIQENDQCVMPEIVHFLSADEFLCSYHGNFQMVFFDIEMKGTDGMEAARQLREIDGTVPILFVTRMAQFAVRGYDVGASGFVVKPILYQDFYLSMKRAMTSVSFLRGKTLLVSSRDGLLRLATNEILYIEVMRHMLYYHTTHGISMGTGNLNDIMKRTEDSFLLCNRSFLVNPHFIRQVKGLDVVMTNGERIPIGRTRKKEFMNEFTRWLGEGNDI